MRSGSFAFCRYKVDFGKANGNCKLEHQKHTKYRMCQIHFQLANSGGLKRTLWNEVFDFLLRLMDLRRK